MLKTDINYIGKMKEGIQRMKPKTKDSGDSKKDINLLYFIHILTIMLFL